LTCFLPAALTPPAVLGNYSFFPVFLKIFHFFCIFFLTAVKSHGTIMYPLEGKGASTACTPVMTAKTALFRAVPAAVVRL
jgi:hypothetical protein